MSPGSTLAATFLLVGLSLSLAQTQDFLSLGDIIRPQRPQKVHAGLASQGHGHKAQKECLQTTQIRTCRAMGCLDMCEPAGGYFQSDFECCDASSGPDYERPQGRHNMYNRPSKTKVAGCAWDFSLLRDIASPYIARVGSTLWPVENEGPYLKVGPAKATCHFMPEASSCGNSFCDDLAITMQGDFYVTLAYSKEPGNPLMAPAEDSCQPVTIINDSNNNFTKPQLMQSSRNNSTPVAGQSFKNMFDDIFDVVAASPLLAEFTQAMKPYSSHRNAYYDYGETMFAGAALVFMGETSVTSLKNGVNVKQTGHLEYTPLFFAGAKGVPMVEQWPVVKGGAMKLWFVQDEEEKEEEAVYSATQS